MTCPGNGCSGHGSCRFISVATSEEVSTCESTSLSCSAECVCDAGYGGNSQCGLTNDELLTASAYREQLLVSISALLSLEDVSELSMNSIIASIGAVAQVPEQLSISPRREVSLR